MLWGTGAMQSLDAKLFWILNSIHSQHFKQGLRKFASHTLILRKLLQNIFQQSEGEIKKEEDMKYKN